ncbi:MAG TPA: response regulator transcription factor [Vicinamibacterales bacterium]|nr:response regulator transcription factor [Vicinamibacterales bacterium]
MAEKPRVIIADDHQLFAAGLERLLAPEYEIVAIAYDSEALIDQVGRLRPDIVVQDLSLPPHHGVDAIREIRQIDPDIRIVVVTMWDDPHLAAEAFRRGASAYILKSCAVTELLDAVRVVSERKSYVTPLIAGGMIQSLTKTVRQDDADRLTDRQREVLRLLAEGKSMKEVATALNLTVRTVAFHKYRIMQMLNIKSSAELVRFAVVQHIV